MGHRNCFALPRRAFPEKRRGGESGTAIEIRGGVTRSARPAYDDARRQLFRPSPVAHGAPSREQRAAHSRSPSRRGRRPPRSFGETIVVNLKRPMGLVLNSGREETGAYVAEVVEGGNAAEDDTLRPTDVLISCGLDDADCRGIPFDDVMDLLARDPDDPTMKLTVRRYPDGPNRTKPEGYVWLEANAKKEGVVVLPSGLQYKVLNSGEGSRGRIKTDTPCSCHYAGALLDGTEFDSSYRRGKPITFAPKQVIKGWTEAMQLMAEGDKWELYPGGAWVRWEGIGERVHQSRGDALVFTIEIVQIMG